MSSGFKNTATKAAYRAGNAIQQGSRNLADVLITTKGPKDLVTDLDKLAEKIIIETIKSVYPDHNIYAEESGAEDNNSEYTWIIDPIDGTVNFAHGHPQYCVSIALRHNNDIILGVIFDPNRNDIYTAELGKGAYLNERRIRVTKATNLRNALIATGFPSIDQLTIDKYLTIFKDLTVKTMGQRRMGSAALDLAYVAAGYVDGFWEFNLKPWDFAAGYLLVKEAGGVVSDFNGDNKDFWVNGNILAGNPKILSELLKIIKPHMA